MLHPRTHSHHTHLYICLCNYMRTHTHTHAHTLFTQLLQHFVTLVQDKVLDVLGVEGLVLDQGQDSSGGTDHDVRAVVLQHLLILLDADTTKEDRDLDVVKVLTETLVLLVDLEGQLPKNGHIISQSKS